jgi:protein ImuB
MLWIALHLPQLPLDTVLRLQPRRACDGSAGAGIRAGTTAAADTASAVADPAAAPIAPLVVTHRKRVGWCNPAAVEAGIRLGMSEANAWSMAADLQVHPRDVIKEQQALQEAALWALHFTPQVALQASVHGCGLLAEVAPSLRLFGGLQKLLAQLARGIAELGLQGAWASAPTATGAWLLAQTAPLTAIDATAVRATAFLPGQSLAEAAALLDALPLHVLDAAQEHLATLGGIGCATLGQLRRLPRGGLARRFGKALLNEIDRAYGDQPEVHRWFEAPETIDLKLELPARVENTEALLFAARRLLLQLTGWLTARHAAVAGITLWLHHEPARKRDSTGAVATSASSTPVAILLAAPSRDADHLGLLLRERLAHVVLVAPVVEIALVADSITLQAAPNTELFPTVASDTETIGRLVERLQSRLGTEAVRLLATSADHRPERSHASSALLERKTSARRAAVKPDARAVARTSACRTTNGTVLYPVAMRPGWLLPQPLALLTRQDKPFYQSPLTLLAGPDRIESGWWDDALALRDYFIAENDRHVLLWIFRLRPDGRGMDDGWFLHGFFA